MTPPFPSDDLPDGLRLESKVFSDNPLADAPLGIHGPDGENGSLRDLRCRMVGSPKRAGLHQSRMLWSSRFSSFAMAVLGIVVIRSQKQVRRINARRIIAMMANTQTRWIHSVLKQICDA